MSTHPAHPAVWAALLAALAGCAGAPRPVRHEIQITAFVYQPASEPVHPGDTLVFVNHDAVPHTATAADRTWDTGEIPANGTHTVVVPAKGIGAYKCAFHPNMAGKLAEAK
jgi:plastocyanin